MVISCHCRLLFNFSVCVFFFFFFFVFSSFFKIMTEQLRLNYPNGIQHQDMPVGSQQLEVNPIRSQCAGFFSPSGISKSQWILVDPSNPTGIPEHPTGISVGFQKKFSMGIASGQWAYNTQRTKFWCQQKCLVTSFICCKFKKIVFEVYFLQFFFMI